MYPQPPPTTTSASRFPNPLLNPAGSGPGPGTGPRAPATAPSTRPMYPVLQPQPEPGPVPFSQSQSQPQSQSHHQQPSVMTYPQNRVPLTNGGTHHMPPAPTTAPASQPQMYPRLPPQQPPSNVQPQPPGPITSPYPSVPMSAPAPAPAPGSQTILNQSHQHPAMVSNSSIASNQSYNGHVHGHQEPPSMTPNNFPQLPQPTQPAQYAPIQTGQVPAPRPKYPTAQYPSISSQQPQRPAYPTPNTMSMGQGQHQQQQPMTFQPMNQNQNSYHPQPQMTAYNGHPNNDYGPGPGANDMSSLSKGMGGLSVTQQGFNRLWGNECIDLLKQRQILPPTGIKPPEIRFQHDYMNSVNCSPDVFRCTLTKIPETKNLLQKSRLPLGILIHPFKDLTVRQLPVIQCSAIVRCRSCRTYINPFVYFIDQRRWKCNLCFRVNDLPDEFQYDPVTRTSGDPSRRPEVRSATIEFLAPQDYMVRPPQAALYLYLLDVSANAVDTGYLKTVCDTLLEELDKIPGDSRSQIGFITFDSAVHFYNLSEDLQQPHQLVVCDIDDIFIPSPENLLVNIHSGRDQIRHLLTQIPTNFLNTADNHSALGAALLAAQKLLGPVGGRITVFQSCLPTIGPGALSNRELHIKNIKEITGALNPSTDFYKKLALECSQQYIAVDLFFINNQFVDIASISCISKFSGGCIYQFPNYHINENPTQSYLFEQAFQRYVTRKIGFEAVMRVRCSRGLSIHTFHGNLFVRSTDLLSLPNCNPDSGFGMQVSIDEPLNDFQTVCFQAALLYTSSKGERRIRVHTLCLPVAGNVNDIIAGADQQCIIGLLAKMAVDRSLASSLVDAREACMNAVVDALSAYQSTQNSLPQMGLIAPANLSMLPTYTHALLRSPGFRSDLKIRLDERVHFMNQMKNLPLVYLIQSIYPDLYPIHMVDSTPLINDTEEEIPDFPLLQLCSDRIDSNGVYLMDMPDLILVYVCRQVSTQYFTDVFGVPSYTGLSELNEFPELENTWSIRIRNFVNNLQLLKPYFAPIRIIRDDSKERMLFVNHMMEDRGESSLSLYEYLQQLKPLIR